MVSKYGMCYILESQLKSYQFWYVEDGWCLKDIVYPLNICYEQWAPHRKSNLFPFYLSYLKGTPKAEN